MTRAKTATGQLNKLEQQLAAARQMQGRGAAFRERKARAVQSALGKLGGLASSAAREERQQAARQLELARDKLAEAQRKEQLAREEQSFAPKIASAAARVSAAVRATRAAEREVLAGMVASTSSKPGAAKRKAARDDAATASKAPATKPPRGGWKAPRLLPGGDRENRDALREYVEGRELAKGYRSVGGKRADFYFGICTYIDKASGKRKYGWTQRAESYEDALMDLEEMVAQYGESGASGVAAVVVGFVRQ